MKRHARGLLIALITFAAGVVSAMYYVYGEVPRLEEMFGLAGVLWILYLMPAIGGSLPIWMLGHRRAKWLWWEFGVLVMPYLVWTALSITNIKSKSIANLEEPFIIGCFVPIAVLVRVVVGQKVSRRIMASVMLIALCLVAFLIYWFVPMQPE